MRFPKHLWPSTWEPNEPRVCTVLVRYATVLFWKCFVQFMDVGGRSDVLLRWPHPFRFIVAHPPLCSLFCHTGDRHCVFRTPCLSSLGAKWCTPVRHLRIFSRRCACRL